MKGRLTRQQVIERAKARKLPPRPAPRSRADAVLDGDALYTLKEAQSILLMTRGAIGKGIYTLGHLAVLRINPANGKQSVLRLRWTALRAYMKATDYIVPEDEQPVRHRESKARHWAKQKALAAQTTSAQSTNPNPSSEEQE